MRHFQAAAVTIILGTGAVQPTTAHATNEAAICKAAGQALYPSMSLNAETIKLHSTLKLTFQLAATARKSEDWKAAHMTLANSLDKWKTETWSAKSEEALAAFAVLKELCAEYMK